MSNKNNQSIALSPSKIAMSYTFAGERIASVGKGVSLDSKLRYGVALYQDGAQNVNRAAYVFADAMKACADEKERANFNTLLASEFEGDAIARVMLTLPAAPADKESDEHAEWETRKTLAEANARAEAAKRLDNLRQTVKAAAWHMANPDKVADGISVSTLAQMNAYTLLEAPKPKKGETTVDKETLAKYEEKKAIAAKVVPMAATPGTTQVAVKTAIAKAKEELEAKKAANAPKPKELTAEEIKAKAMEDAKVMVRAKIRQLLDEWDKALAAGVTADSLRVEAFERNEHGVAKSTFAQKIGELATLAGLQTIAHK